MVTRSMWLGLIVVLLLSVATRLQGAAEFSLWTDEGWTVWAIHDHQPATILSNLEDERHPPLYFLTLSAWWSLLEPERIILRLVSIAAGLLTTAALIRIARDWLDDETALFAGLLFAVLDSAIYYTQELRPYSWLILAGTLMSLFFLRYLRNNQPRWLITYTLSVIFMLYVGYFGLLLLALHGICFVWLANRRQKRGLLLAWGIALVAYLLWLPSIIRQFDLILDDEGIRGYPGSFNTTLDGMEQLTHILFGEQFIWLVLLYILGSGALYRSRKYIAVIYLLVSSAGLLVLLLLVNLLIGVVSARTVSFLLPFFIMVCAFGLRRLPALVRRPAVVVLALSFLLTNQEVQPRLATIDAVDVLAEHIMPGDLVLLETGADDNVFWYEIQLLDRDVDVIRTLPWVKARASRNGPQPVAPQIEADISNHNRVWVIQWLQPTQAKPYLLGIRDFQRLMDVETSTGETYQERFPDETVLLTMFARRGLFEKPLTFGDELQLAGVVLPERFEAGHTFHIDLWWRSLKSPVRGYRILYVLRGPNGRLIPGHVTPANMRLHHDRAQLQFWRHSFDIPADLPPGSYRIRLYLYPWWATEPLQVDGGDFATIGRVHIE
ncbi:MAG: glycosyltransferase family 39 protein [Chloroflexi bacterium]|nr:glycosyltransferase family 39 protein [Chloroflexota bacterium]